MILDRFRRPAGSPSRFSRARARASSAVTRVRGEWSQITLFDRAPRTGGAGGAAASPAGGNGARLASALVASVLCVGLLFVTVFPTRSYLSQRASVHKAQSKLAAIDRQTRQLQREARRLNTPAEIERLARERYGLVRPGERAYAILPAPAPPIGLPEVWPFAGVERLLGTR